MSENKQHFGELISAAVVDRVSSEYVQKVIFDRIDKLIVDAVDHALRSYSDTGKQINWAVGEALKVSNIDLPSYGHTVSQMLKTQIEAKVSGLISGQLAKDMDELLGLAPKEILLSKIVEEMVDDSAVEYGPAVTCIVGETQYGSTWVYLDKDKPNCRPYDCQISMLVRTDGTIASASINGQPLKTNQVIGRSYGLDQKLRAYVACGTKITLDEDNVVTGRGDT